MFTIQVTFNTDTRVQCFDDEPEARHIFVDVRNKLKLPQYQGASATLSDPNGAELDRA